MACIKASGMVQTPRCVTSLYNGTLVRSTLGSLGTQYCLMKDRKAFFYWYLYEGKHLYGTKPSLFNCPVRERPTVTVLLTNLTVWYICYQLTISGQS